MTCGRMLMLKPSYLQTETVKTSCLCIAMPGMLHAHHAGPVCASEFLLKLAQPQTTRVICSSHLCLFVLVCSASAELFEGGSSHALLHTLQGLPLILAAMFLLRWGLMWLEAPLLSVVGNYNLTWQVSYLLWVEAASDLPGCYTNRLHAWQDLLHGRTSGGLC